jgi:hypothetical protein
MICRVLQVNNITWSKHRWQHSPPSVSDPHVSNTEKFFCQCHRMSLMDFVVSPPGCGQSVTDFWGWDAHEAQLRCPDDVDGGIRIWSTGRGLNVSSTKLPRPWSPWESSLSRKNLHGRTGNRTRDLMISSQKPWPLDHEAGRFLKVSILKRSILYFCSSVIHDVQTDFTAITYTTMLFSWSRITPPLRKFITIVTTAATRGHSHITSVHIRTHFLKVHFIPIPHLLTHNTVNMPTLPIAMTTSVNVSQQVIDTSCKYTGCKEKPSISEHNNPRSNKLSQLLFVSPRVQSDTGKCCTKQLFVFLEVKVH